MWPQGIKKRSAQRADRRWSDTRTLHAVFRGLLKLSVDALAFTIDLPDGKYASVNRIQRGWTDPRKSDIYRAVYDAVLSAAQSEIVRTGWVKAECECFVSIMRIMPRRWPADAMNLGKPELDAMTEAGIWTDDRLANPCLPWIRYDDGGQHRVTIIVMKLYEPANVRIVARAMEAGGRDAKRLDAQRSGARQRGPKDAPEKIKYTGQNIPDGMCVVNGYLEPADGILAQILRPDRKRAS